MEALALFAELALGLAGFAGVAVVLSRAPGKFEPADDVRVRALLRYSFTAMFSSLIAYGTYWSGLSEAASVRVGGAVLFVLLAYSAAVATRGVWVQLGSTTALSSAIFWFWFPTMFVAVIVSGVVAAGFGGQYQRLLFLSALVPPMAYSAFGFYRLLFIRPE